MLLTDLPSTLRAGGCRVDVDPGYLTRGQGQLAGVKAIVCHHTGSVSANTWKVVRDGRAGLEGLLSQLVLERDGLWRVLGSGQAWHAGSGGPLLGIPINSANAWTIGIEAVSAGTTKGDWTAAQLTEYPRGVAALCRRYGLTEQQVIFHKTWAPTRKVDLAGWPGDLPAFRASVRLFLVSPTVSRPQEGFLMALSDAQQVEVAEAARSLLFGKGGVRSAGEAALVLDEIRRGVAALRAAPTSETSGPVSLTDADVARIAAAVAPAVAAELSKRLTA